MTKSTFRHEFKYICSEAQLACLKGRLGGIMKVDKHADDNGKYNIRSVYFDDYNNSGYYENENGTDPREKFRIRIYNAKTDLIVLECKRKAHGMTQKQSCKISKDVLAGLLSGEFTT